MSGDQEDQSSTHTEDEMEGEDEEFEVDRILTERTDAKGKVKYLVSWLGYKLCEATWEGAEQFNDLKTIADWERERDNGGGLTDDELAELMIEMDENLRSEEAKQQQGKPVSLPAHPDDERARQPPQKRRDTAQLIHGPLPLLENRAVSPEKPELTAVAGRAVALNSKNSPYASTPSTKKLPSTGARFRSAQHMGQARKNAAQEPPVNPDDPNLKTVSFATAATPASPSDDDLLFFPAPRANRDVEEQNQRPPVTAKGDPPPSSRQVIPVMTKKLLTKPKVTVQDTSETVAIPPAQNNPAKVGTTPNTDTTISVQSIQSAPDPPSSTAAVTAQNGRSWGPNELVVHVTIGQHAFGDLKIVDLDTYSRIQLFALKKQLKSYEIRLDFEQGKILSSPAILAISKSWIVQPDKFSHVKPFQDTAQASRELSAYLQQHDLTAVWDHPATDVVLLLFAPQSAFWRSHEAFRRQQVLPDLVVSSKRRSAVPGMAPIRTIICRYWVSEKGCRMGLACDFAHPAKDLLDPLNGASSRLSPRHETSANGKTDGLFEQTTLRSNAMPLPPRRMSEVSTRPTKPSVPKNAESNSVGKAQEGRLNNFKEAAPDIMMKDAPFESEVLELPQEVHVTNLDWTFDTDYSSLVKTVKNKTIAISSKPYILIALPEQFDVQSQALKSWAERHTGLRSIFVLGKSATREWEDFLRFLKPSDPSILFFHESYPVYTQLKDFSKLLHRDEIVCHAVSWSTSLGRNKGSYQLTPLFPRGNLILITEGALISKPAQASYVVHWFASNLLSKKMTGKLMVRPYVQDFLEKRALAYVTEGKTQEASDTLNLLIRVRELSQGVDVTIPGAAATCSGSLGGDDAIESSGFVPFPSIPGYDHSATASIDEQAVIERDLFLLDYFTRFSVAESSRYRKLLVLHDGKTSQPQTSQHIAFRSVASFVAEVDGHKSKGNDGRH